MAGPVGEHHDEQPVEAPGARSRRTTRSMSSRSRAGAARPRRRRRPSSAVAELARVRALALGDARQHVVVERLHDPQQADARARWHRLSAVRRRSGSGRRAHRCPLGSSGMGSPRRRARCTVRATSSHITAALIASRGPAPRVITPWLRISTAGERWPAERLDDDAPDLLVADERERPDRDLAAELVGHRGQHARDRLAARRPRRRVGAVGVRHAADVGQLAVDVAVRGGVAGGRQVALDQPAVEVADDDRLGRQLVVGARRWP